MTLNQPKNQEFDKFSTTFSSSSSKKQKKLSLLVDKHAYAHKLHGLPEKGGTNLRGRLAAYNDSNIQSIS